MRDVYLKWASPTYFEGKSFSEQQNISALLSFWLLLIYKYKQEGLRLNALIIVFAEVALLFYKISSCQSSAYLYAAISLSVLFGVDIYAHPVYKLVSLHSKYSVGYKTMQLNDPLETEISIYYPAEANRDILLKWMSKKST